MKRLSKLSRILSIILALVLCIGILAGCKERDTIEDEKEKEAETHLTPEEKFDILMDEIFADWVSSDALSLNYFVADPESMNIERPKSTYGETSTPERILEAKQETRETAERLDSFAYEELRTDQQIVYDILKRNIELSEVLDREDDFNYYTGYIRPLIGFQVQLPVLLAEFNFYTAEDIDRYLDIIADTQRYFNDVIEFERERSRRGFFLSNANVDTVLEQIDSFVENRDDNLLITVFDYKIDNYEGLTDEQRSSFKQKNRKLVTGNVLAAYDTLAEAMRELRGVGVNTGGLADLPYGAEYAHARLRLRVGTDKTPQQLDALYDKWLDEAWDKIMYGLYGPPQLLEKFVEGTLGEIDVGTPESYILDLQRRIAGSFPAIASTGLEVLEVHESLQEHMSPAFYLVPAIDRFNENVIYINPASLNDNLFLYTVLAHESYPGHMYQTVYFLQQSPHPVRVALANSGYSEGWATYSEMTSYFFALEDTDEAALMWELRFYDMLLQGYIDLGVNVLGWNLNDVVRLLERFNVTSVEVAQNLYDMVTGIPLNSVMYSIGYIELTEIANDLQQLHGENYDVMEFHREYLEFGSAPFSLIRRHLNLPEQSVLAPAA